MGGKLEGRSTETGEKELRGMNLKGDEFEGEMKLSGL